MTVDGRGSLPLDEELVVLAVWGEPSPVEFTHFQAERRVRVKFSVR